MMGGMHHRRRRFPTTAATLALLIFTISFSQLVSGARLKMKSENGRLRHQTVEERDETAVESQVTRRKLVGPGSARPSCRSKCGRCAPCTAVDVPIHPGMSTPQEYYPEAWRCKCGGKLYMP